MDLKEECSLERGEREVRRLLDAQRTISIENELEIWRKQRVETRDIPTINKESVIERADFEASAMLAIAMAVRVKREELEFELQISERDLYDLNHSVLISLRTERDRLEASLERMKQKQLDIRKAYDASFAKEEEALQARHLLLQKNGFLNYTELWASLYHSIPVHWQQDGWQDAFSWLFERVHGYYQYLHQQLTLLCDLKYLRPCCNELRLGYAFIQSKKVSLVHSVRVTRYYRDFALYAAGATLFASDFLHNSSLAIINHPTTSKFLPKMSLRHLSVLALLTERPKNKENEE